MPIPEQQRKALTDKFTTMGISFQDLNKAFDESNNFSELLQNLSAQIMKADINEKTETKEDKEGKDEVMELKDEYFTKNGKAEGVRLRNNKRFAQLPRLNNNNRVKAQLEAHQKLKEINNNYASIERAHRTQADQIFRVVRDETTGNQLKRVKNSIASYRAAKNRYNVVKQRREGGLTTPYLAQNIL